MSAEMRYAAFNVTTFLHQRLMRLEREHFALENDFLDQFPFAGDGKRDTPDVDALVAEIKRLQAQLKASRVG